MYELVGIIVRKGKAYIAVEALRAGGGYINIEPVLVSDLNKRNLIATVEKIREYGNPEIPKPTEEEFKKYQNLIPKAAGLNSWKALARKGASYSIVWGPDEITLYMSRLDKKGRFETDPNRTTKFPKGTSLETIVETILADVRSRPELMEE